MSSAKVVAPSTQERSNPINIPVKIEIGLDREETNEPCLQDNFRISANTFDPSKSSPPNVWNMRLNKRIAQYFQETDADVNADTEAGSEVEAKSLRFSVSGFRPPSKKLINE
jgi:hypothetical protein